MSSSSPARREGSPYWYIRREIRELGVLKLSTGTRSLALARQYDQLVLDLKELGRLDALKALKAGQVTIRGCTPTGSRPGWKRCFKGARRLFCAARGGVPDRRRL